MDDDEGDTWDSDITMEGERGGSKLMQHYYVPARAVSVY